MNEETEHKEAAAKSGSDQEQLVMQILDALRTMYSHGQTTVTAANVADVMWPDCRRHNANGQAFNLAAGVAGRMLRQCRAVYEIHNRVWQIIPERISA